MLELPIRPLKVLYNEEEQIKELKNIILAIRESENSEVTKYGKSFGTICNVLAFDLAAYKNPAFIEEKEIRLTHLLTFEKSNNFLRLVNSGGHSFGKRSKAIPISFRMRDNAPVTFIEQDFTNRGRINPIKEVIVGPRNNVLPTAIAVFLETLGIGSVKIKLSKASYR